mgnify:FL=1
MSHPVGVGVDSCACCFSVLWKLVCVLAISCALNDPVVSKPENLAPEAQLLGLVLNRQDFEYLLKQDVIVFPKRDACRLESFVLLLEVGKDDLCCISSFCKFTDSRGSIEISFVFAIGSHSTVELGVNPFVPPCHVQAL